MIRLLTNPLFYIRTNAFNSAYSDFRYKQFQKHETMKIA